MRSSTKDTSKGALHEAKGKVKESTGKAEKHIEEDLDVERSRRGKY